MNCDDYLSMLSTLPVEEMGVGRAREHAAGCRDCDRVTRVVVERERSMQMAFGTLHSSVPAEQVAARALTASRRHFVALWYRIGLSVALVASGVYFVQARNAPALPAVPTVRERFPLRCISSEDAAELLRPFLGKSGTLSIHPNSRIGIVEVEAPLPQMARARQVLERFDNPAQSYCAARVTAPKAP